MKSRSSFCYGAKYTYSFIVLLVGVGIVLLPPASVDFTPALETSKLWFNWLSSESDRPMSLFRGVTFLLCDVLGVIELSLSESLCLSFENRSSADIWLASVVRSVLSLILVLMGWPW